MQRVLSIQINYLAVVSVAVLVVSTTVVVSVLIGAVVIVSTVTVVEVSSVVVVSDSLLHATNAPAIAKIAKNFFIVVFCF